MATVAEFVAEVAAKVASLPSAPTRSAASDYRLDLDAVPSGASIFQLQAYPGLQVNTESSNDRFPVIRAAVLVVRGLDGTERAYTEGAMQADLAELTRLGWWHDLSTLFRLLDLSVEVGRDGNAIRYEVEIAALLTPEP